MEIKCNQLGWRSAFIAGLFLNCGVTLGAWAETETMKTLPQFNALRNLDMRVVIGSTMVSLSKKDSAIASTLSGKSLNPNQFVTVGLSVPIVFMAASVAGQYALDNHPLKTILEDVSASVNVQLASGDTPLHVAAKNSNVATELLLLDGRLDPNEHNNEGKTPWYLAFERNRSGSHVATINLFVTDSRFLINSRDNWGRTALHVAVWDGNFEVLQQLLALRGNTYNGYKLDVNIPDCMDRMPADNLEEVADITLRAKIQNALAEVEAVYGLDGTHISAYSAESVTYGTHNSGDTVMVVSVN
jgi:hypothetical protein